MAQFWLATFDNDNASADDSIAAPMLPPGTSHFAIEVLREGDEWAVLFSSIDDPRTPGVLTCHLGFANGAKACNVWLDRGFPLVDATIAMDAAGVLSVVSPFFSRGSLMQYETQLLALSGIAVGSAAAAPRKTPGSLAPSYRQQLQAPDAAQPDLFVTKQSVTWTPVRSPVRKLSANSVAPVHLELGPSPTRCPVVAPLTTANLQPIAVWSGDLQLPQHAQCVVGERLAPQKVAHTFGTPAFRFEEVEVLGFRINLAELGRDVRSDLEALVRPLNFHLFEPAMGNRNGGWRKASSDFRYRAATATLVIELLRYGRMRARVPAPPLAVDDSQSQHELLVRLLVGRVDDDSAQAHAPAVFVPAIFVDNPWSKALGRDAIGFDKRLADFFVRRGNGPKSRLERLLPDGRLATRTSSPAAAEQRPEPLGDIRSINLVERTGAGNGKPLIEFNFPSNEHTDPDALRSVDLNLALGTSALAGTRWRQSDFDAAEFRRSFASVAVADSLRALRTIQVAPVATRGGLKQTWITGTLAMDDDLQAHLPSGVATIKLHAVPPVEQRRSAPSAPQAWNMLCRMLGDGTTAEVTLPTGSWYRLLCSMDLRIDDGLDWNTLSS
jgi:hypothetical protein